MYRIPWVSGALCLAALVGLATPVLGQGKAAPTKLEFKVEGLSAKSRAPLETAFKDLEAVQEVRTGRDGVFQLTVKPGSSLDLETIAKAIAAVDEQVDGPDLRLDPKSLLLSGDLRVEVTGVEDDEAVRRVEKSISGVSGLKATAVEGQPGAYDVKVTSSRPVSCEKLMQAIVKDATTGDSGPAQRLGNITWTAPPPAGGSGHG